MEDQNIQQQVLDNLEGPMCQDDCLEALLENEEGMDFLCDINDLDEAVNRKQGLSPDIDAAWSQFEKTHLFGDTQPSARIASEEDDNESHARWYSILKYVMAGAAAVTLLLFLWTGQESKRASRQQVAVAGDSVSTNVEAPIVVKEKDCRTHIVYNMITIAAGEQKNVTLPDGTEVYLNAKSVLKYAENFGKDNRNVEFCGEGYFKVHHDASLPFVIKTRSVATKVLGTEFNLRCYNAEDVHVTLVKGSVEVSLNSNKVTITPNQDAYVEHGSVMVQNVNPKDFTSWKDGILYFDNASLRTILQQLGRVYNVNVVCRDEQLLNKHFHYMCNMNDSLEEALKLLNASSDINVKVKDNTIVIE